MGEGEPHILQRALGSSIGLGAGDGRKYLVPLYSITAQGTDLSLDGVGDVTQSSKSGGKKKKSLGELVRCPIGMLSLVPQKCTTYIMYI